MNWGRLAVIVLLAATVAAGIGVWYAQNYAYYDESQAERGEITLTLTDGTEHSVAIRDLHEIDATSSPIRWRGCMTLTQMPNMAQLTRFADATPLNGPGWFSCYDAAQIGADLASGAAQAVLARAEIRPDVDQVLAIYPDGRAFGWHQYNDKTPERGVMD